MSLKYEPVSEPLLTPISIKNNRFLKLILLEQTPLLTCFGFVTRQKWLFKENQLKKTIIFNRCRSYTWSIHPAEFLAG
jgi:hypothetical protein